MCDDYIIAKNIMQDKTGNNLSSDWKDHKIKGQVLVETYRDLHNINKATRVAECATQLWFYYYEETGHRTLHKANFCKVRLCPMCSWRRRQKWFIQASRVMNAVGKEYKFLFLTLTMRNVTPLDLDAGITDLLKAFHALGRRKEFKRIIKGWLRTLEITHNWKDDTYHPHLHIVLVVLNDYAKNKKDYLPFEWWQSAWQECLNVDYTPMLRIEAIKPRKNSKIIQTCDEYDECNDNNLHSDDETTEKDINYDTVVKEVTKYVTKGSDYSPPSSVSKSERRKMTMNAVFILDAVLTGRRLVSFGGILKKLHKELNLDDPEDGDLTDEISNSDLEYVIEYYHWSIGATDYELKEVNSAPSKRK